MKYWRWRAWLLVFRGEKSKKKSFRLINIDLRQKGRIVCEFKLIGLQKRQFGRFLSVLNYSSPKIIYSVMINGLIIPSGCLLTKVLNVRVYSLCNVCISTYINSWNITCFRVMQIRLVSKTSSMFDIHVK